MDFAAAAVGNIFGIVAACLFVAGVLKLFQIANTLSEIKDLLQRRHLDEVSVTAPLTTAATPSGEEMLRALDREMRMGSEAGIDPEVINPR